MAAIPLAMGALAQTQYRVLTPDGKILYTDQPPLASPKAHVTEVQPPVPRPTTTVPLARPAPSGVQGVPAIQPMAPVGPEALLPAAQEARAAYAECLGRNASARTLVLASREVVRTRENLKARRVQGQSTAYDQNELDRTWKYYKSHGGTAVSPDEVRVAEDPCQASADKFRQEADVSQVQYRQCAAAHEREIRLVTLSRDVVQGRHWLAMAEKVAEERRRDPNFDKKQGASGEWANLTKIEPAQARAALMQQFAAYRSAGGPETRVEDVRQLPNPCIPERREASAPSPIRRGAVLIPGGK